MDYLDVLNKTYEYADSIKNSKAYKELLEVNKEISNNLSSLIVSFKNAEAKYIEAMKYGKYFPNLDEVKKKFSIAKANLFNEELVKKYHELEKNIQEELSGFVNEVKGQISNKFTKENLF